MKCWLFPKTKIKEETITETVVDNPNKLKIKDLRVYDDVYIKVEDQLYIAWVVEKTENRLLLSYEINKKLQDMQFIIADLENQSVIKELNRVLILNKEDI